jgi:hypothetical protein
MLKQVWMDLQYQPYIPSPPRPAHELYNTACSNDGITIHSWRDKWLSNIRKNKEICGDFGKNSIGELFGKFKYQPAICVGSGPSLKGNVKELKNKGDIVVVSCLHNFHFMEDNGIDVNYYVSLDAGEVTLEEISEGGTRTHEEYLELTKDKTLLCFIGTHPKLIEAWQGKILYFNAPIPDQGLVDEIEDIEVFNTYVSNGGNVLGACVYIAKAILGCNPITFMGADFSFSAYGNEKEDCNRFHGWSSKYDKNMGHCLSLPDIYGNLCRTWQSYFNFKSWFEWLAVQIPGIYINCSEGGALGAFREGNMMQIVQMELKTFLRQYTMHEEIRDQCENPLTETKKLLF